jgi:hypothetical protein
VKNATTSWRFHDLRFLEKLFLIIFGFCRPPFSTIFSQEFAPNICWDLVLIGLAYPGREDLIPAGRGPRDLSHRVFRTTGEAVKNLAGVSLSPLPLQLKLCLSQNGDDGMCSDPSLSTLGTLKGGIVTPTARCSFQQS